VLTEVDGGMLANEPLSIFGKVARVSDGDTIWVRYKKVEVRSVKVGEPFRNCFVPFVFMPRNNETITKRLRNRSTPYFTVYA